MNNNIILNQLINILSEVEKLASEDFSGIGIIVYKKNMDIPTFPLRSNKYISTPDNLVGDLLKISSYNSEFHDGFHLLTDSLKLTHTSQYFSPPIVHSAEIDYSKKIGGRFMAALFGSFLPGVSLTGVLTIEGGIRIFNSGNIIYSKCWRGN